MSGFTVQNICRKLRQVGLLIGATTLVTTGLAAERVAVAAAANFIYVLGALHAEFRRVAPEIEVTEIVGASGSLFAQIKHGAPVDVFLSADLEYPRHLVVANLGDPATLTTFATGQLVVWSLRPDLDLTDIAAAVRLSSVKKIAIAQPTTAPYGRAAHAVLEKLGVWQQAQRKIVTGESITQTAQFVEMGNADLGFLAASLVLSPRLAQRGYWRPIAPELHADVSLDHGAIATKRGATNDAAKKYLRFLVSAPAKKILRASGYSAPE